MLGAALSISPPSGLPLIYRFLVWKRSGAFAQLQR